MLSQYSSQCQRLVVDMSTKCDLSSYITCENFLTFHNGQLIFEHFFTCCSLFPPYMPTVHTKPGFVVIGKGDKPGGIGKIRLVGVAWTAKTVLVENAKWK